MSDLSLDSTGQKEVQCRMILVSAAGQALAAI